MSERYRQPLGMALLGVVLWLVGLAGEQSDERNAGGVLLQIAGLAGMLFLLLGLVWLVVLLLRPKRD